MISRKAHFALAVILAATSSPAFALRAFTADARRSYRYGETVEFGLTTKQAVSGELVVAVVEKASRAKHALGRQQVKLAAGATLLFRLPAQSLRPGDYVLHAAVGKVSCQLPIRIDAGVLKAGFLVGSTGRYEDNLKLGATWAGGSAYSAQKLTAQGTPAADPLAPSGLQQHNDRLVGDGVMAWSYSMWSGYIVHQLFKHWTSWNDPAIAETAFQAGELAAQRLRQFPIFAWACPMDEPGLGYGLDAKGNMLSVLPDPFQRRAYDRQTGRKLPPDPRDLPDEPWLHYFRWRAGIIGRLMAEAKKHFRRVPHEIAWGPDIYAGQFINDGAYPLNAASSETRVAHTFAFWWGPQKMAADLSLERAGWRKRPLCFLANASLWTWGQPPGDLLADMMTNYVLPEGIDQIWYLSMARTDDLRNAMDRLVRYGDLFRRLDPGRRSVAVLFSFTEMALAMRELGKVEESHPYYSMAAGQRHWVECQCAWLACLRAGYPADIVLEEEIEKGILTGRRAVILPGIRHTLPDAVVDKLTAFAKAGGAVYLDAASTVKIPGARKLAADYSQVGQKLTEAGPEIAKAFAKDPLAASRLQDRARFDSWVDKPLDAYRQALGAATGKPEVASTHPHVVRYRLTAGRGVYYLVLNDVNRRPDQPDAEVTHDGKTVKVFRCVSWRDVPNVELTFHRVTDEQAVYVIEGRQWQQARPVKLAKGGTWRGNFAQGEMKVFCVLPAAIASVGASAAFDAAASSVKVSVRIRDAAGKTIPAAVPIRVTVLAGRDKPRYQVNRCTDGTGTYAEGFPLAAINDPPGTWRVQVREVLSGKEAAAAFELPARPAGKVLQGVPDVQVFDAEWTAKLLAAPRRVIVVGDRAGEREQKLATSLAAALKARGGEAIVRKEGQVTKKMLYPRIFPALEKIGKTDKRRVLTVEERQKRRKPWTEIVNWPGDASYPPQFPDAYVVDRNIILLGKDDTSTLVNALQRANLLRRVANAYYPGKGRGLVQYAWSPFKLGKDVVLITGSDDAGLAAAVRHVTEQMIRDK